MLDALCHLHRPPLWDDRARALAEGRRHGVRRVLVAATDRASWSRVLQCRDAGPVALGVHPWWQDDPAELEAVARSEGVEYIGEIGLDGPVNKNPHQEYEHPQGESRGVHGSRPRLVIVSRT